MTPVALATNQGQRYVVKGLTAPDANVESNDQCLSEPAGCRKMGLTTRDATLEPKGKNS